MTLNNAALDEAQRTPEKFGVLESLGGPQFIVAQLFTIVATILGVYLAGYVGFQRTLEYDRYVKAQQQSDLLTAVYAELKDNAARVNTFASRIDETGSVAIGEWPRLRLYVWTAAGQTTSAFDMPPVALSGMQALYDEVGETLSNPRARMVQDAEHVLQLRPDAPERDIASECEARGGDAAAGPAKRGGGVERVDPEIPPGCALTPAG